MEVASDDGNQIKFSYRFSQYFGIRKPQTELEFVDVLLSTDIQLYLDPFALSVEDDEWSVACNNLVVDYFQELLDALRSGKSDRARDLLGNLHEPNETRLGQSRGRPRGRGIGRGQADELYTVFAESKAIDTGILSKLSECELFIDGIGHDKISDITTNIIRSKLIEFTQEQCQLWGIAVENKPSGPMWRSDVHQWVSGYRYLPTCDGYPIVLVPKRSVRYSMALDDHEYYSAAVIEFIRQEFNLAENLRPGSSLFKLLRSGAKVTKKAIQDEFPKNKEFLREVSERFPDLLAKYERDADAKARKGSGKPTDEDIVNLLLKTARIQNLTLYGDFNMHNTTVGGHNFGPIGDGNTVTIGDINIYKSSVDASPTLDAQTKDLLKRAIDEIEAAQVSDDDKIDAKSNLGKLTTELQAEKRPGIVGRCIERLAQVIPAIATTLKSGAEIALILSQIPNPLTGN